MKIMDYEKAYRDALERARNYYKGLAPCRAKDELELIFPELRESEDERIRKWLIKTIHLIGVDKDICADQETMDKAIAWLEKQKEQEHICDSAQYEEGFKTGLEIGLRKQKEQKPSWNPSEEQMKALQWWSELPSCSPGLKSLYEDLKKL